MQFEYLDLDISAVGHTIPDEEPHGSSQKVIPHPNELDLLKREDGESCDWQHFHVLKHGRRYQMRTEFLNLSE